MTKQEAVKRLEALAREWPDSLWLFAASGTLHVMEKAGGKRAVLDSEGFDPEFSIATVAIECDGGDW